MLSKPTKQHQWLDQLVGKWTFESEALMGPDQEPMKSKGTQTYRSLGGQWLVGEMSGKMPNGELYTAVTQLGYDPKKKAYVGTWIGSMMPMLWVYDGKLSGRKLTLSATGPDFSGKGNSTKYRDAIEIKSSSEHVFTSSMQGKDGTWTTFMTARYTRKK